MNTKIFHEHHEHNKHGVEIRPLERVLKALANRRRLAIIRYLSRRKDATVTELADAISLSLTATSKHLSVLKAADIVADEKRSLLVIYSLVSPAHPAVKLTLALLNK